MPSSEAAGSPGARGLAKAARLLAILALQWIVGAACRSDRICDPELTVGPTYAAELLEYYTPSSSAHYDDQYVQAYLGPSCNGFDGLVPGARLSLTITESTLVMGDCKQLEGTVNGLPNGETWTHDPSASVVGGFGSYQVFFAEGRVTSGSCRGRYKVTVGRPSSSTSLFTVAEPGTTPNMVLGRSFLPEASDGGGFCEVCADTFVARLEK
jgi:hypothetical protein